jgi:hypothetical protein
MGTIWPPRHAREVAAFLVPPPSRACPPD